jgi:hypothetical protein
MKRITVALATDTSGACTAYGDYAAVNGGIVYALDYIPGTIDTGATITVTDETQGVSKTIWVKASAGTTGIRVHPRVLEQKNTDGSDLTSYCQTFVNGRIKVVVSSGGASKAGTVKLHVMEM